MNRLSCFIVSLPLLASSLSAGESGKKPVLPPPDESAPAASRDHFQVSAGWMWRETGGVRFLSGSRSRTLAFPSLFGTSQLQDPGIGPADSFADRVYSDGYVGVDEGTANDGNTSLWGYGNAGQVAGDSIRFHGSGSRQAVSGSSHAESSGEWEGEDGGNAPVVQLDWWRQVSARFSAGAQMQWSLLQLDGSQNSSDFSAWHQRDSFGRSFTDVYDLHGVIAPQAPYSGAGLGFGPLLDNIPSAREFHESASGSDRAVYFNDVRQSLDLNVNTLSLGPTFAYRTDRLALQASAGFSLNIASWDADQRETLYLSRNGGSAKVVKEWRDHSSGTDLLPGFYLQSGATCQLTPSISVTGFGRYEWSDELEGSVGPSTFPCRPHRLVGGPHGGLPFLRIGAMLLVSGSETEKPALDAG